MQKILVPTDFSQCAEKASSVALELACKSHAEIHFLHIASVPTDWTTLVDSSKIYPEVTKMINNCHYKLDDLVSAAESKNISAQKYLVYNQNYQGILQHIEKNQVDLVVMGSQGATGLKEFLLGSNTQKVVRMSQVPVLVIKEDLPDDFQVKNIVFASDFREEVMDQFKVFVDMARVLDAKLLLLFVNTPANFTDTLTTKIRMGNYALHAPGIVEDTYVFNYYNFQEGLEKFCVEKEIDMISMITHGGTSGLHLFNNSLTERIVNHVDIPLLTMHFSSFRENPLPPGRRGKPQTPNSN